jgi:hypothetical protein
VERQVQVEMYEVVEGRKLKGIGKWQRKRNRKDVTYPQYRKLIKLHKLDLKVFTKLNCVLLSTKYQLFGNNIC